MTARPPLSSLRALREPAEGDTLTYWPTEVTGLEVVYNVNLNGFRLKVTVPWAQAVDEDFALEQALREVAERSVRGQEGV